MPQRGFYLLCNLVLVLLLTACASTSAPIPTTDFNPAYDFSGVRTFAIQPFDRTLLSSAMISDEQVELIDEALTTELTRRGFEVVAENEEADLFLAWHLITQEHRDVRSIDTRGHYDCWRCEDMGKSDVTAQYSQGTFIVDMIDPVGLRSVWRSIIASRLRDQADPSPAARNAAARAIFAAYPPG